MKATEECFPVIPFTVLQYFPVVLFIFLYKLVEPVYDFTEFLPFKSKILSSPFLLCFSELAILFSSFCVGFFFQFLSRELALPLTCNRLRLVVSIRLYILSFLSDRTTTKNRLARVHCPV